MSRLRKPDPDLLTKAAIIALRAAGHKVNNQKRKLLRLKLEDLRNRRMVCQCEAVVVEYKRLEAQN